MKHRYYLYAVVFAGLLLTGCLSGSPEPRVFMIRQFGAAGDGVHDDSPALQNALAAMKECRGPVRLVFDGKIYRLGKQTDHDAQFDLSGMKNVEIDGQGATLIIHPVNGTARIFGCRNITFKNFVIQHDPLPFMQGTILSVDASNGSFIWKIQDGFPLPPSGQWMVQNGHFFDNPASVLPGRAEWYRRNSTRSPWQWGIVMDAGTRKLKPDFVNHLFIRSVVPVGDGDERVFRVSVEDSYTEFLPKINCGERFVLPRFWRTAEEYFSLKDKGWMFEQNIEIRGSSGITVENLTFYSARPGMVFGIRRNDGPVTVRGCTVTWMPGTGRLIASWRDGVHCKNNRAGPLIEKCRFEGLFDDSINLSADTVMAKEVTAPGRLVLTDAAFDAGDEVGLFYPTTGIWETGLHVVRTDGAAVLLSRPVTNLVTGTMTPLKDIKATQFYNLSRANDGFIVRNNFFGIQRRHAVLARCRGLIENNVIDGVCGRALEFSNESGQFYEGPFPRGLCVRGNRMSDTAWAPVLIRTRNSPDIPPVKSVTGDILFENNEVTFDFGAPVQMEYVENVTFKGNIFRRTDGTAVPDNQAVEAGAACNNIQFK